MQINSNFIPDFPSPPQLPEESGFPVTQDHDPPANIAKNPETLYNLIMSLIPQQELFNSYNQETANTDFQCWCVLVPLKDCISQWFSVNLYLPSKATAEIKTTEGKRLVKGKTVALPDPVTQGQLHQGQFWLPCNFPPRQFFTFSP